MCENHQISLIGIGLNVVDCYAHQGIAYPGGNEYNVSIFAAWLGAKASFIGCFGSDFYSGANYALAVQAGVDLSHSRLYDGECGMAAVTLAEGDRIFLGGNNGGVTGQHPIQLSEEELAFAAAHTITVSGRYSRMQADEYEKLHQAGAVLAYDFGDEELDDKTRAILPHCTYAFFSCGQREEKQITTLVQEAFRLGCPYVVTTLGARGAAISLKQTGKTIHCQAPHTKVVDTMGAGDSFLAAFLVEAARYGHLHSGSDEQWHSCLEAGTRFASSHCTYYGSIGFGLPYPAGPSGKVIVNQRR